MKSYLIKLSGREEGPYEEAQVAQMFADRRIDRNTVCKPVSGGDWKTIDDYLPMLKYGTQLPPWTENRFAQFELARRAGRLRILANAAALSFRHFSAALWTFPERFLACEIDFRGGSMSLERENSSHRSTRSTRV